MKVLIADPLNDDAVARLKTAGLHVYVEPQLREDALHKRLQDLKPQVLVVRASRVDANHLSAPGLALVVRAGANTATIDTTAAAKRGIFVAACPGAISQAVVELAWGLILAADRRLTEATMDLRAGKWNKKELGDGLGLHSRTLGLVGLGDIGLRMIAPAKAFGMKVIGYSRSLTQELAGELGIRRAETPVDLAKESDVISLHLGLNQNTRNLIAKPFFDALKPGAIFVNTSRAEVVDRRAFVTAAKAKKFRVGLDVYHDEPDTSSGDFEEPLEGLYGAVYSQHTGASTDQAQQAVSERVVDIILTFDRTGEVPGSVNLLKESGYHQTLVVRMKNIPGVLAAVLRNVRDQGFNVYDVHNELFKGEEAAVARIRVDGYGDLKEEPVAASHEAVLEVRIARAREAAKA